MADEQTPFERLAKVAASVSSFGVFLMIAGVIGGVGLAVYRDDDSVHQFATEGVALAVGSLAIGMLLQLLGVWAAAWLWRSESDA